MIEFRNVKVTRPTQKHLLIQWGIAPTNDDLGAMRFLVFRSQATHGPWEQIAVVDGDFHYYDYDIWASDHKTYYYLVRAAFLDGRGFVDSKTATLEHDASPIALEMIRKKAVMFRAKSGVPIAVLQKRRWGAHCKRCFDPVRGLPTDPDCPDCYGTGFAGGYNKPVFVYGVMTPPQDIRQRAHAPLHTDSMIVEIGNLPYLNVGDVLADRSVNNRYRIMSVRPTTHRMHTVTQFAEVNKLDDHSRVYMIDVPAVSRILSGDWSDEDV